MGVDAERHAGQCFGDDRQSGADLRRQRASVGVTQNDPLGTRLGGGPQAVERITGVEAKAVEEVLGVEQHALAGAQQKRHRVGDHRQVLLARDADDLLDMQHRRLTHERAGRREHLGQDPQALVGLGGDVPAAGHAEGDDLRDVQRLVGEQLEQLVLLGIRRREARLDQVDSEGIEGMDHPHLLLGGEAQVPSPMPSRRVASYSCMSVMP